MAARSGALLRAVFALSSCLGVLGLEEFWGQCGLTIDLMVAQSAHSGILRMPLPSTMSRYQDPSRPVNCDMIISFASGIHLQIELYFLDIMPRSNDIKGCTTGLEIFDQTGRRYYGSRICMEGWQWEERHRELRYEKHVVKNSPLTLRLVSEGPYRGEGFRLHFNQIRPTYPCFVQEFKCQQINRCVHDDLTCDGWDDCGDYSDEREEAGCNLLTASEICSIIMGIILLLGITAQLVIYFLTNRRLMQQYGLKHESKLAAVFSKYPVEAADFGMGQQYSSEDSIPSRYSRSSAPFRKRQESHDTVNKLQLEKGNRRSQPSLDEKAEEAKQSSAGRHRTQSDGTVSSEPITRTGRKGHTSSQASLNRDRVDPVRGIDNPALDNSDKEEKSRAGSQVRQSSRERDKRALDQGGRSDRYSDHDSDSDSDYNERRRRRSHERSRDRDYKKNQYGDEKGNDRAYRRRRSYGSDDSDYEYERERRRRSRERFSRDRYDDDYSDGDKKRYRREDGRYVDKSRDHRDGGDGDLNSSLDNSLHEDDRGRAGHQNKRDGERRISTADRDKYSSPRTGSKQLRSRDDLDSLEAYRASPSLDLPPPYSEEDTASLSYKLPPPEEDPRRVDHEYTNLPQSNNKYTQPDVKQPHNVADVKQPHNVPDVKQPHNVADVKQPHNVPDVKQPHNVADDSNYRRSSGDRRDRYSQNRWTAKQGSPSSPAAQYGDISCTPASVTYKEDSV
ncbi:hypothetical protein BsWGS_16576 [Bradybaena similaris]